MKNKTKVFFVFLVVFTFLLPLSNAASQKMINHKTQINNSAQLPVLSVGDSWRYSLSISGGDGGNLSFSISSYDLEFTVVETTTEKYLFSISGNLAGNGKIADSLSGKIRDGTINGDLQVMKDNLGIKKFTNLHIEGTIAFIPFEADLEISMIPAFSPYDFPITVGDSWLVDTTFIQISYYVSVSGIIEESSYTSYYVKDRTLSCEKEETIVVPETKYEALKINGDLSTQNTFWYSKYAGAIIKAVNRNIDLHYNEDYIIKINTFDMYLTYSSYHLPGAPYQPDTPQGESNGKPDETYTYTTQTTDDENDLIFYKWDFGDGTITDWIGPYESGEPCEVDHTWSQEGGYQIYVKAKDENEIESKWSRPRYIDIPTNRAKNIAFLNWLKTNNHNFLYQILKTLTRMV